METIECAKEVTISGPTFAKVDSFIIDFYCDLFIVVDESKPLSQRDS